MFFNTAIPTILLGILIYWSSKLKNGKDYFNIQLNSSYDYIIVGAGSAGAVVASRLSEDEDVTVLLIEAGGSDLDNDNIRVPLMVGSLTHSREDWAYYTVPQQHANRAMNDQKCFWPRGRVLGGSNSLNYLVYIRGSRHDYNQWAAEGCKGWSYKDVLPYFLKMEDMEIPRYQNSLYHSRGGPMVVSEAMVTELPDIIKHAAQELEENIVDVNGEDQIGYSRMQSNIRNGERHSTASAYLRPISDRPNLHISLNSFATKILIKDRKVTGVEMIKDNRKRTISVKKELILSGGAVNSPVLLMLSGIGPKQHLQELGIPVLMDLPVGENLEDHLKFFMKYTINQTYGVNEDAIKDVRSRIMYVLFGKGIFSFCGNEGHIFGHMVDRNRTDPGYPDYQITPFVMSQDKHFLSKLDINLRPDITEKLIKRSSSQEFTLAVFNLHPRSKGTIRLTSKDPFDSPRIDPRYLQDPYDVKVLISGIRKVQQYVATNALQNIGATLNRVDVEGVCDMLAFDTDEYWECLVRHYADTVYHPASSCRMGADNDPTSVVDTNLRVKGISGLRIVDGSVMRSETSGNINAPIIMIAEKASDLIRGKNTVERFTRQIKPLNL